MSAFAKQDATLSLRVPQSLRTALEAVAEREANNVNAVARRLLSSAVKQELESTPPAAASQRPHGQMVLR